MASGPLLALLWDSLCFQVGRVVSLHGARPR